VVETISSGSSKAEFVVRFTASNATGILAGGEPTVGQFGLVVLSLSEGQLTVMWSSGSSATSAAAKEAGTGEELSGLLKS